MRKLLVVQIVIVLTIFILSTFCSNTLQENKETDKLNFDWILSKQNINEEFYVENCSDFIGLNCECDNYSNSCGDCILSISDTSNWGFIYSLLCTKNVSLCSENDCDIVIPQTIPTEYPSYVWDNSSDCNCYDWSFHPNCNTPTDIVIIIKEEPVLLEKTTWLPRYSGIDEILLIDDILYTIGENDTDDTVFPGWENVINYQLVE